MAFLRCRCLDMGGDRQTIGGLQDATKVLMLVTGPSLARSEVILLENRDFFP